MGTPGRAAQQLTAVAPLSSHDDPRTDQVRGSLHGVVLAGERVAVVPPGGDGFVVTHPEFAAYAATRPVARWCCWSARQIAPLIRTTRIDRSWDLAQAHRLIVGGHRDSPALVWASAAGLDPGGVDQDQPADLFHPGLDPGATAQGSLTAAGYLDPQAFTAPADTDLVELARLTLVAAGRQLHTLADRPRAITTAMSESGAAALCVELERDGLPVDRPVLEDLIATYAGPRPQDEADARAIRDARDHSVWRLLPAGERVDLRNPAAVRTMLRRAGVLVEDTRAWHLEPYRASSPLVDALLDWRKAERIATTFGWAWLDRCVGADDRLRGEWSASDGGAGRMTAGAGLHGLPTVLRPAVAAAPGWVLVRADLGQVEPRVLAAVSQDPAFAAATRQDDLYAGVAAQLGIDRPTAKIAVLAAMYGQTSGAAGQVLAGLERVYPVAMDYLRQAGQAGEQGQAVMTFGGRVVPVSPESLPLAAARARGRFTRNAVVQGAAAELFKAWALTVRHAIRPLQGRIALCLHDELLVEVPQEAASTAVELVHSTLTDAARRWTGGAPVRFVADVRAVGRWSQAKD